MRISRLLFFLITLVIACSGCSPESNPAGEASGNGTESTTTAAASNEEMADLLARLHAQADPMQHLYLSNRRAEYFIQLSNTAPPEQVFGARVQIAKEFLAAGRTEEAIREFTTLIDVLEKNIAKIPADNPNRAKMQTDARSLRKELAVSHVRLGEQTNCVLNHSSASCIFPIEGAGIHQDKTGSQAALQQYLQLLNEDPSDLESIWLLNVANMTLGKYPGAVPAQWRIPPANIDSEFEIPRFPNVAADLGVDVNGLSGSCILEDFDNDGNIDILATAWGLQEQMRFFRNKGDGTFEDQTNAAGLAGLTGGLNCLQADYDNDGYRDLLVLRGAWLNKAGFHPNSLLRNNGNGTFTDVTKAAGIFSLHPTQTAAWGDFNNDGRIDLFIGNESYSGNEHPCELYQNQGYGTFKNVAAEAGVNVLAYVKGAAFGDYDNDGRIDLYVSALDQENKLFHNEGPDAAGNWTFRNVAKAAGVEAPIMSFPAWFFDYNNDGWPDIFVSAFSNQDWGGVASAAAAEFLGKVPEAGIPRLYLNLKNGTFRDVTKTAHLYRPLFAMGCNFGDLDNDGWPDFYLGTGDPDYKSIVPNRMFRNRGGEYFDDVTFGGGFGHLQKGHGIAFADLDNDGDQDIYAVMGGAYEGDVFQNALFENPGNGNHWVTLVPEGVGCNRDAIGARIRVVVNKGGRMREIFHTVGSGGSFGASSLQCEMGLGDADTIEYVEIRWPGDTETERFVGFGMDGVWKIRQGEGKATEISRAKFEFVKNTGHTHRH